VANFEQYGSLEVSQDGVDSERLQACGTYNSTTLYCVDETLLATFVKSAGAPPLSVNFKRCASDTCKSKKEIDDFLVDQQALNVTLYHSNLDTEDRQTITQTTTSTEVGFSQQMTATYTAERLEY